MKKYIFALFLFIIAIFSIHNVYALSAPYWGAGSDIIRPKDVDVFDCSTTACNVSLGTSFRAIDQTQGIYYYDSTTATSMSANGNGIMWLYQLDNFFKSGYLYSLTTYICHNSSANIVYKNIYTNTGAGAVESFNTPPDVFQSLYLTSLNTTPYSGIAFQKCGFINTIIRPKNNAKFVGLRYTISANSSSYYSDLIGYTIDALGSTEGLTTSDIQNIINNSGLATSRDINSVQNSISNIQTNIIESQEQTRDAIIDNQNQNTDREIESQLSCSNYDSSKISSPGILGSNGSISSTDSTTYGISDYISYNSGTLDVLTASSNLYICYYNSSKTLLSCSLTSSVGSLSIPTNTSYFRISFNRTGNQPIIKYCKNGNQAMTDEIKDLNNSITDSGVVGGIGLLSGWFQNFNSDTFGLTSVITAPLNLIRSITSKTCSPLQLQVPFVNKTMDLPCMSTIYSNYFGSFLTLYQTITFGITSYWICVRIFNMVKDFKNPDHDEIEVMDL